MSKFCSETTQLDVFDVSGKSFQKHLKIYSKSQDEKHRSKKLYVLRIIRIIIRQKFSKLFICGLFRNESRRT